MAEQHGGMSFQNAGWSLKGRSLATSPRDGIPLRGHRGIQSGKWHRSSITRYKPNQNGGVDILKRFVVPAFEPIVRRRVKNLKITRGGFSKADDRMPNVGLESFLYAGLRNNIAERQ